MTLKLNQIFILITGIFLGACTMTGKASAETIHLKKGDYVFPTIMSKLDYQEPRSFEGLQKVPNCEIASEQAIQNYNSYMIALSEATDSKASLIGKTQFVKKSWCHYDLKNPKNFVVVTMTGNERQIALDREIGRVTSGPMFFTFFNEYNDIIKWSY